MGQLQRYDEKWKPRTPKHSMSEWKKWKSHADSYQLMTNADSSYRLGATALGAQPSLYYGRDAIPQVIEAGDIARTWLADADADPRTGAAGAQPLCATGAARPGAQGHSPWVGGLPVWESARLSRSHPLLADIRSSGPALELTLGAN
jgi:hypothetical protein